ncbi:tetratricopeptide repeat protein [uncultured Lacinutrix sp.]|uniref:tetratricopeptide repeat protein n=1 Tax=uncultured Lacinutrix sp. TaxID=574032 RepID=UPI00261FD421|nr:tetratricopeptide repeat protein [uncultured Lacinutrix sp.]
MKQIFIIFLFLLGFFSFSQEVDTTLVLLKQAVKQAKTDSLRIERLLELGSYQLRRDFNTVKSYTDQAITLIDRQKGYDTRLQETEVFQQLGILNRKKSNYSKALQYYLEAQEILLAIRDSANLSSNYHNIGTVYKFQKEYEKSIINLKKAIKINQKLNRPRPEGNNYNMIAGVYNAINKTDSAFYYFNKADEKYKQSGYEEGVYQVIANKSNVLIKQKKYKEALALQLTNLYYVQRIGKKTAIATSHYNLSRIYIHLKKFTKGLYHAEEAIKISKNEGIGRRLALSYKRRSQAYYEMKLFDKALNDYRKFFKIHDSIFNIKKVKEVREIELNYKFERQKLADSILHVQEKKIIQAQSENQILRKKLYFTLFIITLIIAIIIGRYFKKRWHIEKANQEILNAKLKLSKAESNERITFLKSEIDDLSEEIITRKEEITSLMTESLQHLKSKEKLVVDLKNVVLKKEDTSIKSIIADLKSEALDDSRLLMIKNHLEELHFEFYKSLKLKHPELTKTDIEICSYLKLGLGRQEIAKLRHTSILAVKKSRNRIRKKMNLTPEEDLETYIQSV